VEIPLPPPEVILPPFVGDGFRLTGADNRLVINHTAVPANNFVGLPESKITTTRAGTAYYYDAALILQVAPINALRRDRDPRLPHPGFLIERQVTNNLLQSNSLYISHHVPATGGSGTFLDGETIQATGGGTGIYRAAASDAGTLAISNGTGTWTLGSPITGLTSGATRSSANNYVPVWVASGLTFQKNQTGPDGIINSAIQLTASGATGTITQSHSSPSIPNVVSAFIKRISGTSPIEMEVIAGTWVPVTVGSEWTRCDIPPTTTTTPVPGLRILTPPGETDVIAVWCMQNESYGISSPIPTIITTVTRAADSPKMAVALWPYNVLEGTLYAKTVHMATTTNGSNSQWSIDDNTSSKGINAQRNFSSKVMEGNLYNTAQQALMVSAATIVGLEVCKTAMGYKLNNTGFSYNGEATQVDTVCTIPTCLSATFGGRGANTINLCGWLLEAEYRPTRETDLQLSARTVL
jgi:hypothetical protein